MRSDEALMEAVSDGEFEAFEEIVRRHQTTAVNIAYHMLNDADRAEEIAQEAFLKILRNAHGYEPTASFKTYLSRVVTRLCYDWLEKNRPLSFDPGRCSSVELDQTDPLQDVLEEERKRAIHKAVHDLPSRQRTAIVLQHFEGFTYEEIAETMETTERAVEGLLTRARRTLKQSLMDSIEIE